MPEAWRTVRVFISSTFRDMMRERDLLVKEVFPELRRICAQRFVTFTEVDLRWGITEEQAAEGKVLPLCLAEIQRSRPYFLGLLGERYGWIPGEIPAEVVEQEPWLREHLHGRTSVTELEILHGVLNDPAMQARAFFYFRDPHWVDTLPETERREMVERAIPADIERYGAEEAARRVQERRNKLVALKQRIRDSKLPLVEPYASPEALAEIVREQFRALIDELYPEEEAPDVLTRERLAHGAHARQKLFACIRRPAHIAALTQFASEEEHDGRGLVVTGESGGGKSALLAAWAQEWMDQHPGDFLFQHYFGATPDSASLEGFLRRLLGELKQRFTLPDDVPTDSQKLREALPLWLAQTANQDRIVLVLDGLNQVHGPDSDRRLSFLPRHFPPQVSVLASSLPGPALDTLRELGWAEHELPQASELEVEEMVDTYLAIYARNLRPDLRRAIISAPGATNPLFLRTVLEELRQFGSFEKLPARIAYYLEAQDPRELLVRVLRRWQEDFDANGPQDDSRTADLVRHALTHLWAARQGLSEAEWLDLLGNVEAPLPRAHWTPLFLALEPHLNQRAGLFTFGHDFLRQAAEAEFVPDAQAQRGAHWALAIYFELHPHNWWQMTPRKVAEWPYQLHAAEDWDRLRSCLTDRSLFLALYNDNTKWELADYWQPLRQIGQDMAECYAAVLPRWVAQDDPAEEGRIYTEVANFLRDNGQYAAAGRMYRRALELSERALGPEHPNTLTSVDNVATMLQDTGDYAASEPLRRRALAGFERVLGPDHPHTLKCLNNLAMLLAELGGLGAAEQFLRRALQGCESVLGPEHPLTLTFTTNLAGLLEKKGDSRAAGSLYRQALEGRERVLGPGHPETLASLNSLAKLLEDTNDAEAGPLYQRALELSERLLGPEHRDTLAIMSNFGLLLEKTGDYAAAESWYRHALEVNERVLGAEHEETLILVSNVGSLLEKTGRYAAAESMHRRTFEARERVLGPEHPRTLKSLNHLALLLDDRGDYATAEPMLRRVLGTRERVLGPEHPDTLTSLSSLASLLKSTGRHAAAEPLLRQALETSERVLGPEHPDTLRNLSNLASLLESKGDPAGAEPLLRRALAAHERVLGLEHTNTLRTMGNLALLLVDRGDYADAEPLLRRALEASERVLGPEHPDTLSSVNSLAGLLESTGDYGGAEALFRQVLEARERVLGPEHPDTLSTMGNLAFLLASMSNYASAQPLFRRALEASERVLGHEHPATVAIVSNLAGSLERAGDSAAAEPLYRRALELSERVLGPEHPDTLRRMRDLAAFLQSMGSYELAEPLYRRALEAYDRVFGPEHLDTLRTLNNLATLLDRAGDSAAADRLFRRALEASERALGPEHPDTLAIGTNLASLLERVGDYAAAGPLYRRAFIGFYRISQRAGRAHPHLQSVASSYARMLMSTGLTQEQAVTQVRRELGLE
jgi:tetratricopeptide (TPR) repeat protein